MIRDIIESRAKQTPTDQPLCKRLIAAGAMKAAMPPTVWVTGCSSWYLGKDGLPELFPWTPERHRDLLRQPELADFDVRTA